MHVSRLDYYSAHWPRPFPEFWPKERRCRYNAKADIWLSFCPFQRCPIFVNKGNGSAAARLHRAADVPPWVDSISARRFPRATASGTLDGMPRCLQGELNEPARPRGYIPAGALAARTKRIVTGTAGAPSRRRPVSVKPRQSINKPTAHPGLRLRRLIRCWRGRERNLLGFWGGGIRLVGMTPGGNTYGNSLPPQTRSVGRCRYADLVRPPALPFVRSVTFPRASSNLSVPTVAMEAGWREEWHCGGSKGKGAFAITEGALLSARHWTPHSYAELRRGWRPRPPADFAAWYRGRDPRLRSSGPALGRARVLARHARQWVYFRPPC